MAVIRIEASMDDILEAVAQLPNDELAAFAERVAALRNVKLSPWMSSHAGA